MKIDTSTTVGFSTITADPRRLPDSDMRPPAKLYTNRAKDKPDRIFPFLTSSFSISQNSLNQN
ncbi:hypothetical protein [Rhodohalobacter sp. SW132]|uniref:hypothetical protein n=1 Tax=Rhodohalobacter sp. SW132 TaxID=2293433 RepID=UPI0011C074A4|nr:hypothetical protein [Rhodohalobacter sp. SW132]